MNYEIIPDSELSVDSLLDSANKQRLILSETEAKIMKKSPWSWYLISGETPEKNKEFYRDAGYCAFETVITMDNSFHNAMTEKYLEDISVNDINIEHKIKNLNKLSDLLGLKGINANGSEFLDLFFQCKMKGFELADVCAKQLTDEYTQIELNVLDKNKRDYAEVLQYVYSMWTEIAFVKGSYVDYVESHGKTKYPFDIDLGFLSYINQEDYYEIMKVYNGDARVGKIPVVPLIIPLSAKTAHSFFDLDINVETKFIYSFKEETLTLRTNPEKIIQTVGNRSLKRIRRVISDEDKLNDLRSQKFAHSKIYSTIRKPEMMYKKLIQNVLGNIVAPPENISASFEINMSVKEIQNLMAQASLENSKMNQALYNYVEYPI